MLLIWKTSSEGTVRQTQSYMGITNIPMQYFKVPGNLNPFSWPTHNADVSLQKIGEKLSLLPQRALKLPLAGSQSVQTTFFLFSAATCISLVHFLMGRFGGADKNSMAQQLDQISSPQCLFDHPDL